MSNSTDSIHEEFRIARDLLLRHGDEHLAARRAFRWPRLATFNWAIDWFDVIARDNDRVALRVVTAHGEDEVTYHWLSRRSDQVAGWLRARGVRRGDVVMVLLDNRIELWELMLALMKVRAVIAPGFTTVSRDELLARIGRAQARHVIADSAIAPQLDLGNNPVTRVAVGSECAAWLNYADSRHHNASFTSEGPTANDEPLFYYFTSGTTSRPKLVVHTHVSYSVGHLSSMYWNGLRPGDVHLNVSAPGWAKYPWSSLFGPWNAEATMVSMDTAYATPGRVLEVLGTGSVTSFCAPPSVWRALVRTGLAAHGAGLREAVSVGEPLTREIVDRVRQAWGVTVRNGYGQSEVTALVGITPGCDADPISLGYPLPGYDIVLCPTDSDEEAAEGELCVDLTNAPVGMMRGYLDEPGQPAILPRQGLYRTGDLARWSANGSLTYIGRRKDVFRGLAGVDIAPVELEHALLDHPAVSEAAVVPVSDEDGELVPKGYVVLAAGWNASIATAQIVLAHAGRRLPAGKAVILVEFLDDLPRTESGKIRRESLRHLPRSSTVEFSAIVTAAAENG